MRYDVKQSMSVETYGKITHRKPIIKLTTWKFFIAQYYGVFPLSFFNCVEKGNV